MNQNEDSSLNSPSERSGEGKRLWIKARECDAAWRENIPHLAESQGNDVFKYVLLLTCIECHSYVTETQIQARRSFRASSGAAVAGFCLVATTILAMLFMPVLVKDFKVEITTISILSGVMTTFISTIFFKIFRDSQERMERFHDDLRKTLMISCGLFLKGIAANADQCDEERMEIIRFLMRSDVNKAKTSGKYQKLTEAAV
jgi:hypothetical protein